MAKRRSRTTALIKYIIGVGLMALLPLAAAAATITVNTRADNTTAGDSECTLREAIANVNAAADTTSGDCTAGTGAGDTITFNLALPTKIKLTLGQLLVEQDVTIAGPNTGSLRISGARASGVFRISTGTTSISNLTIEQGNAAFGGGIRNEGTVILTNCTLKANKAGDGGGGIYNAGTATLINCTLDGNKGGDGSGIYNSGTATLTNCTLARNRGGRANGDGGGIANAGTATLTNCTLTRNKSGQGGGVKNGGIITLVNCTLKNNRGLAGAGGGILNTGTTTLTNCTLEGNKAYAGKLSLGGGGIWHTNANLGTTTLINTIVANSSAGKNCAGDPISSAGHNLSSDSTCFTSGGTDLLDTDPLLARLANYGGPTETMVPCTGAGLPNGSCTGASPAIDAGDDAVTGPPDNLTTDQRGLPRKAGLHVDIGADEVQ